MKYEAYVIGGAYFRSDQFLVSVKDTIKMIIDARLASRGLRLIISL